MKIKRYLAKDMREAIRLVREAQGPDAVILSTTRTAEGLELIAAVDYDEALMHQAMGALTPAKAGTTAEAGPVSAQRKAAPRAGKNTGKSAGFGSPAGKPGLRHAGSQHVKADPKLLKELEASRRRNARVDAELKSIKQMLETQVSRIAFGHLGRENPVRAQVLRELTAMGIENDLAVQLVASLPAGLDTDRARRLPLGLLSKRVRAGESDLTEQGGVVALVGPTGVGKTTTIAKLAARHVMKYGRDDIALVTTDMFRIGGQEQMYHYGRLLGIPAYSANDAEELRDVLARLRRTRTVLVDTAGMSHRDMRLTEQLALLRKVRPDIRLHLALSVNQQTNAMNETADRCVGYGIDGLILTKLDEASEIGGALSVAIRKGLCVNYITDGQRVPEDIRAVRAHHLVTHAVELARNLRRPSDQELSDRFGGCAHALA